MADLTDFRASPSTRGLPALEAPAPDNASGQQLTRLGDAFANAGRAATAIHLDQLQTANRTRVDEAVNALREQQLDDTYGEKGFTRLRGRDALFRPDGQSLTGEYTQRLDQHAEEIASSLGNEAQRTAFRHAQQEIRLGFESDLRRHTDSEFHTYTTSVREGVIATGQRGIALSGGDPERTAEFVAQVRAGVAQLGRDNGQSAEWIADRTITVLSSAHADAIARFLDGHDVSAASRYMELHRDEMTPDDMLRVDAAVGEQEDMQLATSIANEQFALMQGGSPAPAAPGGRAAQPRSEGNQPARFRANNNFNIGDGFGAARPGGTHHGMDAGAPIGTPWHVGQPFEIVESHRQTVVHDGRDGGNMARVRIGNTEWFAMHLPTLPARGRYEGNSDVLRSGDSGSATAANPHIHWQPINDAAKAIYSQGRQATAAFLSGRGGAGGQQGQRAAGTSGQSLLQAVQNIRADPRVANNPRALAEAERQLTSLSSLQEHAEQQQREDVVDEAYRQMAQNGGHYERLPASLRSSLHGRDIPGLQAYGRQVQEAAQGPGRTEAQALPIYGQIRAAIASGEITRPEQILRFAPQLTTGLYRSLIDTVTGQREGRQDAVDSIASTRSAMQYADLQLENIGISNRQDQRVSAQSRQQYENFQTTLHSAIREAERAKGSALNGEESQAIVTGLIARRALLGNFGAAVDIGDVIEHGGPISSQVLPYDAIPPSVRTRIAASLARRPGRRGPVTQQDVVNEYIVTRRMAAQQ